MSKNNRSKENNLSISDWIQFLNNEVAQAESDESSNRTMTIVGFSSMIAFLALLVSMFSFFISTGITNEVWYPIILIMVAFAYVSIRFTLLARHNNKEIEKSRIRADISRSILYQVMKGNYVSSDDILRTWDYWFSFFIENDIIKGYRTEDLGKEYPQFFKRSKN